MFSNMKMIPDYDLKEPFYKEGVKWTSMFNWEFEDKLKRKDKIIIHDCTLRDGDQTPGSAFLEDERVRIADALAEMRVPRIEAGMPVVSKAVESAMRRMVAKRYLHSKIYGFARAMEKDIDLCYDIGCEGVIIEYTVNPYTIKYAYKNSPAKLIEMLVGAINKAKDYGMDAAFMGWDWFRTPVDFTMPLVKEIVAKTALDGLVLVDTFGCATPDAVEEMTHRFKSAFPQLRLEFHGHNDIGCGSANCLAAMNGGADVIHTAVNGMGERCGNVQTELMAVLCEMHKGIKTGIKLDEIAPTCELVRQISHTQFYDNMPVMGDRPYKVEPGIIMDIIWKLEHNAAKKVTNYCITVDPSVVGREDKVQYVLGKSSGTKTIQLFLEKYNIQASEEQVQEILDMVVEEGLVTKGLVSERMFLKFVDAVKNQDKA